MAPDATVMLIEDNAEVAAALEALFVDQRFGVIVAPDSTEGLAAARQCQLDCVLVDVHLPNGDGWSIWRALRAADPLRPLIALPKLQYVDGELTVVGTTATPQPFQAMPLLLRLHRQIEVSRRLREVVAVRDAVVDETLLRYAERLPPTFNAPLAWIVGCSELLLCGDFGPEQMRALAADVLAAGLQLAEHLETATESPPTGPAVGARRQTLSPRSGLGGSDR